MGQIAQRLSLADVSTVSSWLAAQSLPADPRPAACGAWSAEDFWRALHNGKSRDGRLLYPAFPYPNYTTYTNVSREDADALFAYLRPAAATQAEPAARAALPR
jgi:hypothetical protein